MQEGPEPVSSGVKVVLGHKFTVQESRSTKHYCEKCNAMILGVIQAWLKCSGKEGLVVSMQNISYKKEKNTVYPDYKAPP